MANAGSHDLARRRALLAKLGVHAAPHHRRDSRPRRAGRRVRRVSGRRVATAARSFPTRSRAARARCCGRRAGFQWRARGRRRNVGVDGPAGTSSGAIADFIYGIRRATLWMAGVTGTNGKTSCAHWIAQALDACGRRAAIAGHARQRAASARSRRRRTRRPTSRVLHETARAVPCGAGAQAVAMEVSSHGLEQGRVNGVDVRRRAVHEPHARPSRLSRTMAAYGAAKARLFAWPRLAAAVINADDAFGQSLDRRRARARPARAHVRLRRGGHRRRRAVRDRRRRHRARRRDAVGPQRR